MLFITYSGDINSINLENESEIVEAVVRGDLKEVKPLIQNGADVNIKNKQGNPALIVAYKKHQRFVAEK